MSEHKSLKKIPLGLANFSELKNDNYAYIDKTRFIEILENLDSKYPLILRPRRFGKSLSTYTLQAYYDKAAAKDFNALFADTYIGKHKTPLANQFYVLMLSFAGLGFGNDLPARFLANVKNKLTQFFNRYPHPRQDEVLKAPIDNAVTLIETFFAILGEDYRKKIYVIIDEYDQFANEILAKDVNRFKALTSSQGFLKDFFAILKDATGNAVSRIFITGVTSISLDSMTSGFSIAVNYSSAHDLAEFAGFSEAELRHLIPEVLDLELYQLNLDDVINQMREWYNGYRFSPLSDVTVFNASMCLYYLNQLKTRKGAVPNNMTDPAVSPDLSKIEAILSLGDPDYVAEVVRRGICAQPISFPAGDLQLLNLNQKDEFDNDSLLSALFYLGFLTYAPNDGYSLIVPNRVMRTQFFEYYLKYIIKSSGWKFNAKEFEGTFSQLIAGVPDAFFRLVADRFHKGSGINAGLHLTENSFQTLLFGACLISGAYRVRQEVAVEGTDKGFIDLLIESSQGPESVTYVVEFKYLPKKKGTDAAIAEARKSAIDQAQRYAQGDNIRVLPQVKCIACVFVGTELKALDVL